MLVLLKSRSYFWSILNFSLEQQIKVILRPVHNLHDTNLLCYYTELKPTIHKSVNLKGVVCYKSHCMSQPFKTNEYFLDPGRILDRILW